MVITEARDTHTFYQAFNGGTVTPCLNGLDMSRPGLEYRTSRIQCEQRLSTTALPMILSRLYTANNNEYLDLNVFYVYIF